MRVALSQLTVSQAIQLLQRHGATLEWNNVQSQLRSLVKVLKPSIFESEIESFLFDIEPDLVEDIETFESLPLHIARWTAGTRGNHGRLKTANLSQALVTLPPELLSKVLSHVRSRDIVKLSATCTEVRQSTLGCITTIDRDDLCQTLNGGCAQLMKVDARPIYERVTSYISFISKLSLRLETLHLSGLVLHVAAILQIAFPTLISLRSIRLEVCSRLAAAFLGKISENSPNVTAVYIEKASPVCRGMEPSTPSAFSALRWNPLQLNKLAFVRFSACDDHIPDYVFSCLNLKWLDVRLSRVEKQRRRRSSSPTQCQSQMSQGLQRLCCSFDNWHVPILGSDRTVKSQLLVFFELTCSTGWIYTISQQSFLSVTHLHLNDVRINLDEFSRFLCSEVRLKHVAIAHMLLCLDETVIETLILKQQLLETLVIVEPKCTISDAAFVNVANLSELRYLLYVDYESSAATVTGDFIGRFCYPYLNRKLRYVGIYSRSIRYPVLGCFGNNAVYSVQKISARARSCDIYQDVVKLHPDLACCAAGLKGTKHLQPQW